MSSLLYQLSYNPIITYNIIYKLYNYTCNTDKGLAPLFTGHEPIMLLLHQSAIIQYNILYYILAQKGFEPLNVMMKTLCLRPLDYKAL